MCHGVSLVCHGFVTGLLLTFPEEAEQAADDTPMLPEPMRETEAGSLEPPKLYVFIIYNVYCIVM